MSENDKRKIKKKIKKIEKAINSLVRTLEIQEIRKSFISEIPAETLKEFSDQGQLLYKSIYVKNRLANKSILDSLEISKSFTLREDKAKTIRLFVLKEIQKELNELVYNQVKKKEAKTSEEEKVLNAENNQDIIAPGDPDEIFYNDTNRLGR